MLQTTLRDMCMRCDRLPNLRQRSHEELVFGAMLLHAIGELTLPMFASCLCKADDMGLVDIVFPQLNMAMEWDGGYYHDETQIERDTKKTIRLIQENAELIVLRIRHGAPRIEALQCIDKCICVHVPDDASLEDTLIKAAEAVQSRLPESYASLLLRSAKSTTRDIANVVVCNLRCKCDTAFGTAFDRLSQLMGDRVVAQKIVDSVHGVRSHLAVIVDGLVRMQAEWGMQKADLCTFMSDSVAAAISGDAAKAQAFWDGVGTLKTEWGMQKVDLCTFMSNSVAAAISGDAAKAQAFWDALHSLREFFTLAELSTFVCGGIATRLKNGHVEDIIRVITRVGSKTAKTLLTKQPLLCVLPELVAFMQDVKDDDKLACYLQVRKRKQLLESLQSRKKRRGESFVQN